MNLIALWNRGQYPHLMNKRKSILNWRNKSLVARTVRKKNNCENSVMFSLFTNIWFWTQEIKPNLYSFLKNYFQAKIFQGKFSTAPSLTPCKSLQICVHLHFHSYVLMSGIFCFQPCVYTMYPLVGVCWVPLMWRSSKQTNTLWILGKSIWVSQLCRKKLESTVQRHAVPCICLFLW